MDKIFYNTDDVIQERRNAYIKALGEKFVPEGYEYKPESLPKKENGDNLEKFTEAFSEVMNKFLNKEDEETTFGQSVGGFLRGQSQDWLNNWNEYQSHINNNETKVYDFTLNSLDPEQQKQFHNIISESGIQRGDWLTRENLEDIQRKFNDAGLNVSFISDQKPEKINFFKDFLNAAPDMLQTLRMPEYSQTRLPDNKTYLSGSKGDSYFSANSTKPFYDLQNIFKPI